jgi:FERM, RhoGEF and pleckstrin domain protein 2
VEWELRSPDKSLKTPSQTKRPVDVSRRLDSPIGPNRIQTTSVQVETYQTTKYAQQADYPAVVGAAMDNNHQDSSRSVSPGAPGTWTSPSHISNNVREADLGRARQDGHNTGKLMNNVGDFSVFHLVLLVSCLS